MKPIQYMGIVNILLGIVTIVRFAFVEPFALLQLVIGIFCLLFGVYIIWSNIK